MECPKCKKGFITEQKNKDEDRMVFGNLLIIKTYDRFYEFCSNVLCPWKEIRRVLVSEKRWNKELREFVY